MWYNVLPGIGGIGGNGACMYAGPAEPNAGTGYPIKWGWGTASIAFYSREQPVILIVITVFNTDSDYTLTSRSSASFFARIVGVKKSSGIPAIP
jgi:alpha-D-ribose 1-methylphosphonate 5-phosphate C-P lyase